MARGRGRVVSRSLVVLVPALAAGITAALLTVPEVSRPSLSPLVVDVNDDALGRSTGGGLLRVAGRRPPPPRLLRISSAGVLVPVDPVRVNGDEPEVPRANRVGWVRSGPRPGEPGRTVLIGHRDSSDGLAPFAALATLEAGALVEVVDGHGRAHRYRVDGITQLPKSHFPAAGVYAPTDRSTLALITCEGVFEPASGYRDNLIVFARPA